MGAGPTPALFEELHRGAGGDQGRVPAIYGDVQTKGAGEAQDRARAGYDTHRRKKAQEERRVDRGRAGYGHAQT